MSKKHMIFFIKKSLVKFCTKEHILKEVPSMDHRLNDLTTLGQNEEVKGVYNGFIIYFNYFNW